MVTNGHNNIIIGLEHFKTAEFSQRNHFVVLWVCRDGRKEVHLVSVEVIIDDVTVTRGES